MTGFDFRRVYATTVIACLVSYLVAVPVRADVTLDGSLGPSGALTGPNYEIPASVGEQVGPNLFHSFGVFNINNNESATFTGPTGIENVLGRVTGGESSNIDGDLNSDIPGANLYLINPAGIMFGPNAQLNVDGSFHASTADYVKLGQDGMFSATDPETSTLTVAPPSAFGFLNPNPAPISLQAGTPDKPFAVPPRETFSIVGGNIRIAGGYIFAPDGRVNLASVASPGEVKVAGESPNVDSFARLDNIEISQGTVVAASGGGIFIRGGQLTVDNSGIATNTFGMGDGAVIDIEISGDVIINNGVISAGTTGEGDAGTVTLKGRDVMLTNAVISSSISDISGGTGTGNGGDVILVVPGTLSISGTSADGSPSGLLTVASTDQGDAGNISVSAGRLSINGGVISADTFTPGRGGNVTITIDGPLVMNNGGFIEADTYGDGDAGTVTVQARDATLTSGSTISSRTFGAEGAGTGNGGDLHVVVPGTLSISGAPSNAHPSGLDTTAQDGQGDAGKLSVSAGRLDITNGGAISAYTLTPGRGGVIDIEAGTLTLAGGGTIGSSTSGSGDAGSITIDASKAIRLQGFGADIDSVSLGHGDGDAGDISVSAPVLIMSGGAHIDSSNFAAFDNGKVGTGRGAAGQITIDASKAIRLFGTDDTDVPTAILAVTGKGNAGGISVSAPLLTLDKAATITTQAFGSGRGGDINVMIDGALVMTGVAGMSASTSGEGDAGNITVTTGALVMNGGGISADTDGKGSAGNISVSADRLSISNYGSIDAGTSSAGAGGNVTINTNGTLMMNRGFIAANTAGEGDAGILRVNARNMALLNGAQVLSAISSADSGSTGAGNGGDTIVVVTDTLSLSGSSGGSRSGIFTSAGTGQGDAGDVFVSARKLNITNGGVISSSSFNSGGDAGDIIINVVDTAQLANGGIGALATQTDGGNIRLTADSVQLRQGSEITSRVFGSPDTAGGNVTINGGSLVLLDDSKVSASALKGKGGVITVNSDVFLHDAKSVRKVLIATSGTRGNDGTVTVNSPDTDIAGSITRLPISFLNAAALLSQRCAARPAEDTSSFVIIGRGGVPRGPDDWALSSYASSGAAANAAGTAGVVKNREELNQVAVPPLVAIKLTCAGNPPVRTSP